MLNFSGCGTGKTLTCIHAVKSYWPGARVLVLAPLTILEPAWKKDLAFGWPQATVEIAYAKNREKVFKGDAQWIITNHDAVKKIADEGWHTLFDVVIVDEADVFRNRESQRSEAMLKVAKDVQILTLMTGTPTPKSVTDVWHLAFMVDGGERLGSKFFEFRNQMCYPKIIPGVARACNWVDKPEANMLVTAALADISTRVELNDVQELPQTVTRSMTVNLPAKLRREYESMRRDSMLFLESGGLVNAVHAGARMQKLLQMCAGAIYDEHGVIHDLHPDRHKLVLEMVLETDHALVAFNWKHQRDGLVKEALRQGIAFEVIDGDVTTANRERIVRQFQAGELQAIFAHPQSAGHGLTLTRANRVIWSSPTYRADLYEQFNHRIVRTGQERRTEIIHIAANATAEQQVYEKLMTKKASMDDLLTAITGLTEVA